MAKTNPTISEPKSPGWWVDVESCICGESYEDFRAFPKGGSRGSRFSEGCDMIRRAAGGFEKGGGYRSRRSVLWALRVYKLGAWYSEHSGCSGLSTTGATNGHSDADIDAMVATIAEQIEDSYARNL